MNTQNLKFKLSDLAITIEGLSQEEENVIRKNRLTELRRSQIKRSDQE